VDKMGILGMGGHDPLPRSHLLGPAALILIGVTGVVLMHGALARPARAAGGPPGREITVSGSAMTPSDLVATVAFQVLSEAADGQAAETSNVQAVARLASALKRIGVAESDILEGPFRLTPVKGSAPARYEAQETIRVTIGTKGRLADVVDAALRSGATSTSGVTYIAKEPPQGVVRDLIRRAVASARTRARFVAEAFGVTLGQVQNLRVVSEGPRTGPSGQSGWGVSVELTYRF